MARHTTYADNIVIAAVAHVFNLRVVIFSSLRPEYDRIVQPEFKNPNRTVTIGHYGEGSGLHYVCIDSNSKGTQGRSQPHSSAIFPLSSFFLKSRSIFLIFPQTLLIFFLILALRVRWWKTRPTGKALATPLRERMS